MILVNLIILALFVLLVIRSKGYERTFVDSIDSNEHKLKQFFPTGLYILDHLAKFKKHHNFSKQEESLRAIYIGESIDRVKRIYICNKIVIVSITIFVFNIISIFSYMNTTINRNLENNYTINRPGKYGDSKTIKLDVYMTEEDIVVLTDEITLDIQGRKYSKEELQDIIIEGKTYIDLSLLKDNNSVNEIVSNINLVSYIPDTDLYVDWEMEDYDLISSDGKVNNEDLEEAVTTWIIAVILYEDIEVEYKIDLTVCPPIYTKEELAYKQLLEKIEEVDEESSIEDTLVLPSTLNNMEVFWEEQKDSSSLTLLFMGFVVGIIMFVAYDKDLYDKVEYRNKQMLLDYPEIINKVTLLLGAGMPVKNAWHKIVDDYKGKCIEKDIEQRYAYEEMIITSNELYIGISEITAYESFGRRVKLLPYLRFTSLVAQNIKKGSEDLLQLLEIEVAESFEDRKELAKRIGEEAGTKLLFPMMFMLLIVLVIIVVPAFLSF